MAPRVCIGRAVEDGLSVVKYLIEEHHFDPSQPQLGRRSYEGRTPYTGPRGMGTCACEYLLET